MADRHEFNDYHEAQEAYFEKGWTDGLPIVPPTPELVERFLGYVGLTAGHVLGAVPTREVTVTAEHVAINAVMAGCKAEYMPVVVAAVEALLDPDANLHSTTATLAGAAHAVIVNGPIRNDLDVNCKAGCFGPGWRANATMGRALRLVVRNVCKSIPGFLDRATFSQSARFTFCFGENEEDSPWIPLHVERGLPQGSDAVTVASARHIISAQSTARTPEAILDAIIRMARTKGVGSAPVLNNTNDLVVVIGQEHMRYIGDAGWSKKAVREYLYPRMVVEPGPGEVKSSMRDPDEILVVAAGGQGMTESWTLHPHQGWAITRPIVRPGGR